MTALEIMQRAKMYMEKLAQGIDPISDQEIPEDSVLNNVRLARRFFYVSGVWARSSSTAIWNAGLKTPRMEWIELYPLPPFC